jgi:hypothetical protein
MQKCVTVQLYLKMASIIIEALEESFAVWDLEQDYVSLS